MSASSPAFDIETRNAGAEAEVRSALGHLDFQRRWLRAAAEVTFALSCALALLLLETLADYRWLMPRTLRAPLTFTILFALLLILARAIWHIARRKSLAEAAREIERAFGTERNTLVTLAENLETEQFAGSYLLKRLAWQARDELERVEKNIVAPRAHALRAAAALSFVMLVIFALSIAAPLTFAREVRRIIFLAPDEHLARRANSETASNAESGALMVDELRVRVVPPSYTGLAAEEIGADEPVRALMGSRIELNLHVRGAGDEGATLSFNSAQSAMRSLGEGYYNGSFVAHSSGAMEARIIADENRAPAPFVRAVEVYADAPPEARITEPEGDQLLRSVPGAPVTVRFTARDDIGLESVTLKYVKSRGEGDAAKFTNGELAPTSIERMSAREWHSAATLDLAKLDVRAGDTLVFWIEARDRQPTSNNTGRSASLSIAISGPEGIKLNLSDLKPNEIGQFLLSERQIIINTEKLNAERKKLSQAELLKRSNEIAADQREFKNSFNDYIKIEGEGEESVVAESQKSLEERASEAAEDRTKPHEHGPSEPALNAPPSVREMTYAIRAMWDAEYSLVDGDTEQALVHEREALSRLKRAQSAVRYIPPIVAQHKPIDLKRRYAGELAEIKTRLEKLARRGNSKESQALRAALADAYSALGDLQSTLGVPASARSAAVARARERARTAADRLSLLGGVHAATVAEAVGELRVVETELGRVEMGGSADEYAERISKPLALLTQAASSLFSIAEASTRAGQSETNALLPTDDACAAEYFRRLAGGKQ